MVWLPADEHKHLARLGQALSVHRRTRFVVVCEASSQARPSVLQSLHNAAAGKAVAAGQALWLTGCSAVDGTACHLLPACWCGVLLL